jgi:exodeoxyribonuclease-5
MVNGSDFTNRLLDHFVYEPTSGQVDLIRKLDAFLIERTHKKLFILKGYAGTGKTSLISAMVNSLQQKAVLMAPTGRAAKVFSAYSGKRASTIHRRIYFQTYSRDGRMVLTLQKNKLKNALFIIDEASMIPAEQPNPDSLFSSRNLLDDLIEYVYSGEGCSMILIGDTAQLPPVGIDISPALEIDYLKTRYRLVITTHELKEVMRQALKSGILANATKIREQLRLDAIQYPLFSLENQLEVERITGNELEEALIGGFTAGSEEDTIVVTRSNKRANIFNQEIRRRILYRENEIESGDLMMVVRNNYFWLSDDSVAGFIANGDIIEIQRIQRIEEMHGFRFADVTIRLIDYPDEHSIDVKILLDTIMAESPALKREEQNRLFESVMSDYQDIPERSRRLEKVRIDPYYNALQVKFANAMTCHKTQGGQWDTVFIDQGYLRSDMVDNEYLRWLYTAVTRAKKKLYLVNFSEMFF